MVQDAKVLSFNKNKQFGDQNCKQNPFWNQFGAETYILLVLFFIHILRSMAPTKMWLSYNSKEK